MRISKKVLDKRLLLWYSDQAVAARGWRERRTLKIEQCKKLMLNKRTRTGLKNESFYNSENSFESWKASSRIDLILPEKEGLDTIY